MDIQQKLWDSADGDTVESLRQRNDDLVTGLEACDEQVVSLRQQLADHIRREVMLRDALHFAHEELRGWHEEATGEDYNSIEINEALAATADLKDVILCHAEPCRDDGRCQYAIDHGAEGLGHCPEGKCCIPLYRA